MKLGRLGSVLVAIVALLGLRCVSSLAFGLEEVTEHGVDGRTIEVCWGDDNATGAESWTIRMRPGTSPPTTVTKPVARIAAGDGSCHRVGGLRMNAPYTFLIVVREESGVELGRGTLTAAARVPGGFAAVNGLTSKLPSGGSGWRIMLTAAGNSRRVDAIYYDAASGELVASSRSAGGTWSRPINFSGGAASPNFDPRIASNDRGDVVAAWQEATPAANASYAPAYAYRPAGSRRWSHARSVGQPGATSREVLLRALAIDNAGHLHFLVSKILPAPARSGLYYDTNATGRWTEAPVAGCQPDFTASPTLLGCDVSLMTYDPALDRIVVVVRSRERPQLDDYSGQHDVVRIADKKAAAMRLGPMAEISDTPAVSSELVPSSVTSRAGQTTLALASSKSQLVPGRASTSAAGQQQAPRPGLYLMTGRRPANVGGLTRIPGTSGRDVPALTNTSPTFGAFLVAAATRDRVVLARQRDGIFSTPSWNVHEQGIWLEDRVRDPTTGTWHLRRARHLTNTPYDLLDSLAIDYRSAPVVGFHRY